MSTCVVARPQTALRYRCNKCGLEFDVPNVSIADLKKKKCPKCGRKVDVSALERLMRKTTSPLALDFM